MRFKCVMLLTVAIASIATALQAGVLIEDRFNSPKLEHRDLSPARGEWKIADGVATCTQDDELFK